MKTLVIAVVSAAVFSAAAPAFANSIGELELARIAKKSGSATPQQQDLLERYGH